MADLEDNDVAFAHQLGRIEGTLAAMQSHLTAADAARHKTADAVTAIQLQTALIPPLVADMKSMHARVSALEIGKAGVEEVGKAVERIDKIERNADRRRWTSLGLVGGASGLTGGALGSGWLQGIIEFFTRR